MRPTRSSLLLSVVLLAITGVVATLLSGFGESARAATATLAPSDDTYSSSASPTTPLGASVRFSTQGWGQSRTAYLKFPVSLPAGTVVTAARLRLRALNDATPEGVELRGVADVRWSEATLRHDNRPAVDSRVADRATGYSNGAWVELDATSLVRRGGPVALALTTAPNAAWSGFSSKESGSAPELVVTTAPGTGGGPSSGLKLHSTATEPFVTASGQTVRLNGLNLPAFRADGSTWEPARFQHIADRGFTVVRLMLSWNQLEPAKGSFDAKRLATLDTAVARAKAAGLYVILDGIHLYGADGLGGVPTWARAGDSITTVETNGLPYLTMLAARYRDESAVAAYDPVNEFSRWPVDQNAVLRTYAKVLAAIRTVDPATVVLMQPAYGDSSVDNADFSLLPDKRNIAWSPHFFFAGGSPTGYRPDGAREGAYTWSGAGYNPASAPQLEAHLLVQLRKTRAAGIPMWIGSFGIREGVPGHEQYLRDALGLFRRYGIARSWAEYSGGSMAAVNADYSWKPWIGILAPARPTSTPTPTRRPGTIRLATVGDMNPPRNVDPGSPSGLNAASIRAYNPDIFFALGDLQYHHGDCASLVSYWDKLWGPLMPKMYHIAGPNHDWVSASNELGSRAHANGSCAGQTSGKTLLVSQLGRPVGPGDFWSRDVGAWHIVGLPTGLWQYDKKAANAITATLDADLAAAKARGKHLLVGYHEPYYTGSTDTHVRDQRLKPWVDVMDKYDVRLTLSGSQHNYERSCPVLRDDTCTPETGTGTTAFQVSTGGIQLRPFNAQHPSYVAKSFTGTHGWLELLLEENGSFSWKFHPVRGTGTDSGSRPASRP